MTRGADAPWRARSKVSSVVFEPNKPGARIARVARQHRLALVGLLALAAAVATLASLDSGVLCTLPALALALLTALRRYPGERALMALSSRRRRARRERSVASVPTGRARIARPRGGLLLGCSLAVRPPPVALAAAN